MLDPWDWKTSAPEFVPGTLSTASTASSASIPSPTGDGRPTPGPSRPFGPGPPPAIGVSVPSTFGSIAPVVGAWCAPMPEPGLCIGPVPMCAAPGGPVNNFGTGQWQGFQGHGYVDMHDGHSGHNGHNGHNGPRPSLTQVTHEPFFSNETWEEEEEEDYAERIRAAQVQARYEMQLRSKEEELRSLQDRLNRKEDETARMQADFERDRQGLLYNLNQLSHAVAEKKVQDRYDGRNFDRDRGPDRQSTHWRQESKREAVNSFERHPGSAHRYGPKDRTTPDRSDRAERSARMRKALEKTAAAGAWSGPRLEKFVRQTPGTMELRPHHAADGSTSWTLRLCMDDLNPPLNDEGMQVFCRWLHQTFQLMREQHSIRSMQMVSAELSMAWNHMGDDALGRLLQALQRSQVRVRSLKFGGNNLSPEGLSQLCDFIHEAHFTLREVDLSHNVVNESSALELLKLFVDPKYSKRVKVEPVKVDLSHNGLHTSKILKKLGSCGLSLQSGIRSNASREWHVMKNGMPLVRLPDFESQDMDLDERKDSNPNPRANVAGSAGRGRSVQVDAVVPRSSEASPPEETPEPARGESKKSELRRPGRDLVKGFSRPGRDLKLDKLRIEEHPNEDDEPKKPKVIEVDDPRPEKAEKAEKVENTDPPVKPVRLLVPPKILQRGAQLTPAEGEKE